MPGETPDPVPEDQPPEKRLTLEDRRLALEEKRVEYEQKNRDADRRLHEIEVNNQSLNVTGPQRTTIIAAIVGVIGAALGAAVTGYFSLSSNVRVAQENANAAANLEKEKFEIGIILEAVKTNNPLNAVPVLRFYATAGFIPTYKTAILALANTNEGSGIPVTQAESSTTKSAFIPQSVISACIAEFPAQKSDAAGFVRAVAAKFGVTLVGTVSDIIDAIQKPGWEVLPNGVVAAERARTGYLVIGGLKGDAQTIPSLHSLVVVVVDGPLGAGKYPTAFWGNVSGNVGDPKTTNWAWSVSDRDRVVYAARQLNITASQ